MPLDDPAVVTSKSQATQDLLQQLYRLRNEGKNLDSTIELLEAQLWETVEVEALEGKAGESAKV